LATPVLSYNGSNPFPAVIGESMALTPAVSATIGHYTVNPPLPPGLSLDGQSGVISGTPTQARGRGVLRQRPLTGAARSIPGRSTRLGMRRWTPS